MRKKRRKVKLSTRIKRAPLSYYVCFSFVMIIGYAVAEMYLTYKGSPEHSTLTACWFGCWAGEVLMTSLIKLMKLRKDEDNNDGMDNK